MHSLLKEVRVCAFLRLKYVCECWSSIVAAPKQLHTVLRKNVFKGHKAK